MGNPHLDPQTLFQVEPLIGHGRKRRLIDDHVVTLVEIQTITENIEQRGSVLTKRNGLSALCPQ